MNKTSLWGLLAIIIIGGIIWYAYNQGAFKNVSGEGAGDWGTYAYECDERVALTMTPASDMSTIKLAPSTAGAAYPPVVTLEKKAAASGVRYEGGGVILTARGETITLGEGDSAINCSPVPSQTEAPFNFGD